MNHDASKSLKRRYRRSYRPVDLVRRVPIANTREKTDAVYSFDRVASRRSRELT